MQSRSSFVNNRHRGSFRAPLAIQFYDCFWKKELLIVWFDQAMITQDRRNESCRRIENLASFSLQTRALVSACPLRVV